MGLEIIGAGFGRTGTTSLKQALEDLGFGPCHHMLEIREHPEQLPAWQRAAEGEHVDWDEVFAGYRSQVDWPGARYWRELALYYPDAKVILSVRDPERWFESVQETIWPFVRDRASNPREHARAMAEMGAQAIVAQIFDGRIDDKEHAIAIFNRHIADVKATIEPERLLVFDAAAGWEPLCRFLGVPVPDEPYPRTNTREDFKNRQPRRAEEPAAEGEEEG